MQTSKVYINTESNEEFVTTIMKNLKEELCQGKMASGKMFVAKLVGCKKIDGEDVLLFQIRDGSILLNKVGDLMALRKFNPDNGTPNLNGCRNPRSGDPHERHRNR